LLAEYLAVNARELWSSVKAHERQLVTIGFCVIGFSLAGAAATRFGLLTLSSLHHEPPKIVSANISTSGVKLNLPPAAFVNQTYQVVLSLGIPGSSSQERQTQANNTLIRLVSSGLQIDPAEPQNIVVFAGATGGQVQWTLRPSPAGHFPLSISSKAINPSISSIPILETRELQVNRRFWDYVQDSWPLVSGFFGTFLTLPGIVSFWKQWREDRKIQKTKGRSEADIHPGDAAERMEPPSGQEGLSPKRRKSRSAPAPRPKLRPDR
jgi:hypothetical protein